jgi:hypothetical protein
MMSVKHCLTNAKIEISQQPKIKKTNNKKPNIWVYTAQNNLQLYNVNYGISGQAVRSSRHMCKLLVCIKSEIECKYDGQRNTDVTIDTVHVQ